MGGEPSAWPFDGARPDGRNRRKGADQERESRGPLSGADRTMLMPLWHDGRCPITDLGSAREATARLGGYLPMAPGVSTIRYPIPERIFDYVSTVRSATAERARSRHAAVSSAGFLA